MQRIVYEMNELENEKKKKKLMVIEARRLSRDGNLKFQTF